MSEGDEVSRAEELALDHLARGDAIGWFEALYQEADGDAGRVPWARLGPHPLLLRWVNQQPPDELEEAVTMVVGCGLGDDAELLAQRGCRVTAFDVAESSIRWCRQRFPKSRVDYRVMDLFALPQDLCMRFDLVVEIYTLQSMPIEVRKRAYAPLVSLLTPGGALVVVSHGRDDGDAPDGPPWPLSVEEIDIFSDLGLSLSRFEDHSESRPRRFVAIFRAPRLGLMATTEAPASSTDELLNEAPSDDTLPDDYEE